jgi:hypothetical protein
MKKSKTPAFVFLVLEIAAITILHAVKISRAEKVSAAKEVSRNSAVSQEDAKAGSPYSFAVFR